MNFKTKIGTVLMLILISLIFFSKTIYTYNLPVVTAGTTSRGSLYKVEEITGFVAYTSTWDMYADISGKAAEVLIKEGDKVAKGTPVIIMSYDIAGIEQALSQLEISRAKLALDIENINMQITQTNNSIEQLTAEVYAAADISDVGLKQLEKDIAAAETDYKSLKLLYDAGGLPQKQLDDSLAAIEALKATYKTIEDAIEKDAEAEARQLQDKEKARELQLEAYNYSLQVYERQLKTKELDLRSIGIQEAGYRSSLNIYAQSMEILAPSDGIVTWIGVKAGQRVNEGQLMFEAADGYKIECLIPEENDFIELGDAAGLPKSNIGTVTKIELTDNKKKLTVEFEADEATVGETLTVRFQKRIEGPFTLIENGALKQDGTGYFVYQIKRRNGLLGKEYCAERMYVQLGGSDGKSTAIVQDIGLEPVVVLSDKPIYNNDIIKVKNESDFFDN